MKSFISKSAVAAAGILAFAMTSCSGGDSGYAPADTTATPAIVQNILTRTSIRRFAPVPVSSDTIDILLHAAMAAPSAKNVQPWKFVVVTDRALLKTIGERLPNVGPEKMENAQAAIVVCGEATKFIPEMPDYWVQDCSAATENLLLAAHACGLGAVWCGIYPDTERVETLRSILGLSDTLVPLNIVPVGVPDAVHNPIDKFNPDNIIRL
ncbi:MAG: nitroreductase family protein [Muribaculaceae bacterium]|nr:nitroreductase family protein [Muribaculaceae bacterium]